MSEREEEFELDSHALAMIAAYRQEESLPADVRARVWDRVEGEVGVAPASGSTMKWAVVLFAAAAAIAVAVIGSQVMVPEEESVDSQQAPYGVSGEAPEEPAVHVERTKRRAVVPPQVRAPEVEAPEVAPVEPSEDVEPRASKPRARRAPRDRATEVVEPEPVEAAPVDTLAEETRLLARAQKAVFSSRPNDALAILAEAERRFPTARLGPERSALRAIAMCDLGRSAEGKKAADAFLAAHSGHALANGVREACKR